MSIVDQMLTIEGSHEAGIECAAITYEMSGAEGTDRPLIYFAKAARNLVSTGNRDELVSLAAPERVIGARVPSRPRGADGNGEVWEGEVGTGGGERKISSESSERIDLAGEVEVPLWVLYGSASQVGGARVRATASGGSRS